MVRPLHRRVHDEPHGELLNLELILGNIDLELPAQQRTSARRCAAVEDKRRGFNDDAQGGGGGRLGEGVCGEEGIDAVERGAADWIDRGRTGTVS